MPLRTHSQAWALLGLAILLKVAGTTSMRLIGFIVLGVMGLHSASRVGS
jgi:hypothetical protein